MTLFNFTLEDSSPLITYLPAGAWSDSPSGDSLLESYSGDSLHTTSARGATATFTFNGTGIWLFGGHRSNYGTYELSIDGQTTSNGNGNSVTPEFKQLLGGVSGLVMGEHTVVLTNTASNPAQDVLDLDSVMFETQVGSAGARISSSKVDDSDPRITYKPTPADWDINDRAIFYNSTLHFSQTGGAQAALTFSGDAVAVFGTVSPDHANYTVSVDGQTSAYAGGSNGLASVLHPQILLFFANNLGSGSHDIIITGNPSQTGQTGKFMDLDGIEIFSAEKNNVTDGTSGSGVTALNGSGPSTTTSPPNSSTSDSAKTGVQKFSPLVIGAIVASAVGAILIVILFLLLIRRRKRSGRKQEQDKSPLTPALPIQRPDMVEAGLAWGEKATDFGNAYTGSHPSRPTLTIPEPVASRFSPNSPRNEPLPKSVRPETFDPYNYYVRGPIRPSRPPSLKLPSPGEWSYVPLK